MEAIRINSALISVYNKDGLEPIVRLMHELGIVIYSTGGTQSFIEQLGIPVIGVETITDYPSILGGRVKTLHPKIFGGILAMRTDEHLSQLVHYHIPLIDLVLVDLYPFEETLRNTDEDAEIIEKIDIGGISLIRAAAKNFNDIVVIAAKEMYGDLTTILHNNGISQLAHRKELARQAFRVSSSYDHAIFNYFGGEKNQAPLRYGENPHQKAWFEGDLKDVFDILQGKELSYNNILDVDAALLVMEEFYQGDPCFAVLKHTNVCGLAVRSELITAWKDALAGDPISAFGGILICNKILDLNTAKEIDGLFYEVLIAPDFEPEAIQLLSAKKNRILLRLKQLPLRKISSRTAINGILHQEMDQMALDMDHIKVVTHLVPTEDQKRDLIFAERIVKHLKSNAITLIKNSQLIGMGCGQTSRIDAAIQAIDKSRKMGFDPAGSVMASEAFFPFPDCVEIAAAAGIKAIIQPGGSVNDGKSITRADELQVAMVLSGIRHFKH